MKPFTFVLVLAAIPAVGLSDDGSLAITGPIDPNYAIEAEATAPAVPVSDEYEKEALPVNDETFEGDEVREGIRRLEVNEGNELRLYDQNCQREKIGELRSLYARWGYAVGRLEIHHSEMRYQNWQGLFFRIVQSARLTFADVSGRHRPDLQDVSACKTRFFRWQ